MKQKIWIFWGLLFVSSVKSTSGLTSTSSLVVSSTESPKTETNTTSKEEERILPKIYEMRVEANVSNRFAKTLIASKVRNLAKSPQEATFSVILPDQAYISGFTMEIDGKSYEAYVQEKQEAENTYKNAIASGQAAAHVALTARDSNRFTVSVNVEPQSKATFYLRYEELLVRQSGKYAIVLNINPGQLVKKLNVEVHINESRPLKFVRVPSLRTGNEISKYEEKLDPRADVHIERTSATVKFSPDIKKQKKLANNLGSKVVENGLSGQFVVEYDVERDPYGGEVLVDGGYFVHFFAPTNITPLPKHVIFVLDTSGSMEGVRITQLKEAMRSILAEHNEEDVFSIVEFGTIVKVWNIEKVAVQYESGEDYYYPFEDDESKALFKNRTHQPLPQAVRMSEENIKKAEKVVEKLMAFGGTDIYSALKISLQLIEYKYQPLIVFLTDGEATVGETYNEVIIKNITALNPEKFPIISLAFGDGADIKFLEKLSLKNSGFTRRIYEGADAPLQLEHFYKQISSPLLSQVTFKYASDESVTKTEFPVLFDGSEIVVSGHIGPGFKPNPVESWRISSKVYSEPVVQKSVGPLERHWAYLTLKQVLEQRDAAENKTAPTQEALRIALKYSFVTDVTSLVVVKPNVTDTVETEDATQDDRYPIIPGGGYTLSLRPQPAVAAFSFNTAEGYSEADDEVLELVAESIDVTTDIDLNETEPDLDAIKFKLPWLVSVLNEYGTLNISAGLYELGLNKTINNSPECFNSPNPQKRGFCKLLHKCPQIYPQLTDEQALEKYFCALNGYAGVCCPEEQTTANTTNIS